MTRLIHQFHPDDGINLAQGFPDFPCPQELKDAACDAIQGDVNQYAITWGSKPFRDGIAAKTERFLGIQIDPEREITVCCGATEAMISTMLAVLNPGDEVIIFEPFYENYGPDCILSGAAPQFVRLNPPDWSIDWDGLERAFTARTRAVVLNTPNNPTGKVFTRDELGRIARLCGEHDCLMITDEIYEHMVYDGAVHVSPITLPGMRERTIVINGLSKTYSVTGWRVGYVLAPPTLTDAIRKVHDFLTVGAPAPLQAAGAVAMHLPGSYYETLCRQYQERRDFLLPALRDAGFFPSVPAGAYYIMCDISAFAFPSDVELARCLVEEIGLAAVPGSSFYHDPKDGRHLLRFAFPKRRETLERAQERLETVRERLKSVPERH
jgi:aminotransferase